MVQIDIGSLVGLINMRYIVLGGIIISCFFLTLLFYEVSKNSNEATVALMQKEGKLICEDLAKEGQFKSYDVSFSELSRNRPVTAICKLSNGNIVNGVSSAKEVDISLLVNKKIDKSGEILRSKPRT